MVTAVLVIAILSNDGMDFENDAAVFAFESADECRQVADSLNDSIKAYGIANIEYFCETQGEMV